MPKIVMIKNWEKYQHYSDRNPPWIKLHNELLTSKTWVCLNDASKALAVAMMLLASRTGNAIPADPDYIQRLCYLETTPDLKSLERVNFIEIRDIDEQCLQPAIPRVQSTDKRTNGSSGKKRYKYPDEFESLWLLYPKRSGTNPKRPAYHSYRARLSEGVEYADLVAGVKGYAEYCAAAGKIGTEFVMQGKRFFGTSEEWKTDWTAPLTLPKDPQALFAIRKAAGLHYEFDDLKTCHAEIQSAVRDPEKRKAVEAIL